MSDAPHRLADPPEPRPYELIVQELARIARWQRLSAAVLMMIFLLLAFTLLTVSP